MPGDIQMDDIVEFVGEYADEFVWIAFAVGLFYLLRFWMWDQKVKAVARERKGEGKGPLTRKDIIALKRLVKYNRAKRKARMKQRFNALLKK
ncbi:MAG: hypothetical protein Q8Q48_04155 [Candidatus Staskawiczbacteria bacterium]|nr:hypothetical protein [Candidatus Staskawiczbacteria bacterium]